MNHKNDGIFWINIGQKKKLATKNLYVGNKYDSIEQTNIENTEFQIFSPYQSKLAAAIFNGLEIFPIKKNNRILYISVSDRISVNHISDIVGNDGRVYWVVKDDQHGLVNQIIKYRKNIIPVWIEESTLLSNFQVEDKVDVIFLEINDFENIEYLMKTLKNFLKIDSYLMLIVKTNSINLANMENDLVEENREKISSNFEIIQEINLTDFDKTHSFIIAKYINM